MVTITQESCDGCGLCAKICPRYVPVLAGEEDSKKAESFAGRADLCIACGQCAALCRA